MKVKKRNPKNASRNMTSKNVKENFKIDNTIEEMIKKRNVMKSYSRSLIEYVPLTKREKVNIIEDMDEVSSNRFQKYSNIFEQIKNQIYDINQSIILNSSCNVNEGRNNSVNKKNLKLECDYIEEREEENIVSPTTCKKIKKESKNNFNLCLVQTLNMSSSSCVSSNDDEKENFDLIKENKTAVKIYESPQLKSMHKTKISNGDIITNSVYKSTTCSTKENATKFNQKEFYCEPKLNEDDNNNNKTVSVKYCYCLIY